MYIRYSKYHQVSPILLTSANGINVSTITCMNHSYQTYPMYSPLRSIERRRTRSPVVFQLCNRTLPGPNWSVNFKMSRASFRNNDKYPTVLFCLWLYFDVLFLSLPFPSLPLSFVLSYFLAFFFVSLKNRIDPARSPSFSCVIIIKLPITHRTHCYFFQLDEHCTLDDDPCLIIHARCSTLSEKKI